LFATRLPRETCEDLRVAIEEVGRNAIEWGNRFDPQKRLRISYCFFHDRVVLKFEDEGEGFQPQSLPDPSADLHGHLAARASAGKRPGGFGVLLVQSIMDEVVYSEKGNVVVMTKFISPSRG
ncbi:MAG: ATP-binding protein, partial [Planctomycetota bacterium]|nr:ATP-binding protein [Planctomycetota bacterium]